MRLQLFASLLTAVATVGSFGYVSAHPKNPLAPLQPPVLGRLAPAPPVELEEEIVEVAAPTPVPSASPTPQAVATSPARTAQPTRVVVVVTPAPTATPRPTLTLTPAVRVAVKKQPVTNTYVS